MQVLDKVVVVVKLGAVAGSVWANPGGYEISTSACAVAAIDAESASVVLQQLEDADATLALGVAQANLIETRETWQRSASSMSATGVSDAEAETAVVALDKIAVHEAAVTAARAEVRSLTILLIEDCCGEGSALLFDLFMSNASRPVPDHWKVMSLSTDGWATLESAAEKMKFGVTLTPAEEAAVAQVQSSANVALAKTRIETLGPQLAEWQAQVLLESIQEESPPAE